MPNFAAMRELALQQAIEQVTGQEGAEAFPCTSTTTANCSASSPSNLDLNRKSFMSDVI